MSPLVFGIQSDITQDFVSAKAASLRLSGILNGIDDCWDPAVDPDVAGILGKLCRSEVVDLAVQQLRACNYIFVI